MKRASVAVLALGVLCGGHATTAQPAPLPRWLIGCWAGDTRRGHIEERWFAAGDSALVGVGTTTADGVLREFEFLRIVLDGATLSYIAQPGGRPPTTFTSASATATEVIFENAQNDFPKRVSYRRTNDALLASLDNGAADDRRRQQFPMTRAACDK